MAFSAEQTAKLESRRLVSISPDPPRAEPFNARHLAEPGGQNQNGLLAPVVKVHSTFSSPPACVPAILTR